MIVAAAKLCPIGRLLDRGDFTDYFDAFTFASQEGQQLEDVPVLLDHDPTRRVGDVTRLWRRDGWWQAELHIDSHKHRLGCLGIDRLNANPHHGVSLGCDVHHERQAGLLEGSRWIRLAVLREVSLTRHPTYPGARVDVVVPIPRTRPPSPRATRPTSAEKPRVLRHYVGGTILAIR